MGSEDRLRVLIVEDEPLISMALEAVVSETVESTIVKRGSVAEAEKAIDEPFDFVLLDINVTNGETYDIARTLKGRDVPFAFVTATSPPDVPDEFRDSMMVTKPIPWERIQRAVLEAKERKNGFTGG